MIQAYTEGELDILLNLPFKIENTLNEKVEAVLETIIQYKVEYSYNEKDDSERVLDTDKISFCIKEFWITLSDDTIIQYVDLTDEQEEVVNNLIRKEIVSSFDAGAI